LEKNGTKHSSLLKITLVDNMGRKQSIMDQYKQQMKTYHRKKMKKDNTPYLPDDDRKVYVMNSLDPIKKIEADVLKTRTKQHREIIEILACPICENPMEWDNLWEAFICEKHGKKAIYELLKE
jgi:hypothetical protein